jgi:streptogramin lyase
MLLGGSVMRRLVSGFAVAAAALATVAVGGSLASRPQTAAPPVGTIKYFSVPSLERNPYWITPGPDGNLWFTDTAANKIGRITLGGQIVEFKIGKGKRPKTIVTGPDGNLWFTESAADKIGVMSPRGILLHEYTVPTSGATPWGITVGPDGNVWFAEQGTGEDIINNVGTVVATGPDKGLVTEYELEPCACFPIGITTGPDGNLWATEELGIFEGNAYGTVDRVSPAGEVTQFPVDPDEPSLPGYPAPGPDGNVWFGEFSADRHKIGKITPDGTATEYTVPVGNATVNAVVTGPDGNLWFTHGGAARNDNGIQSVTPDGTFLDNYLTHMTPIGLTVGPDGNIWFVSGANGEIGRLQIAKANRRYVLDIASGFVPRRREVRLGTVVQWMLEAPGEHGVSDATGLELFESDVVPAVASFSHRFSYAGTYPYDDPPTGDIGRIAVMLRAPRSGRVGQRLTIEWGRGAVPEGLVFDVQIKRPGARSWSGWRTDTSSLNGNFTPGSAGSFRFRARLDEESGPAESGWSPPTRVRVR